MTDKFVERILAAVISVFLSGC